MYDIRLVPARVLGCSDGSPLNSYCPKCSETYEERVSAKTKGGKTENITHKKCVKNQTEEYTACQSAREAIEKKQ